jgi:NADH-quinone oxidoreductase subunit E
MAAINDYYYTDLTPEGLVSILDDFAEGKSPAPGSYGGRRGCAAPEGPLTLQDPCLYDGSRAKAISLLPNMPREVVT